MRLRWSDPSLRDLAAIRTYIATDNPVAADRVLHRINHVTRQLLSPIAYTGRAGHVAGTYELVVTGTPYLVIYRRRDEEIEIVRVLHGAQKRPTDD